MKNFSVKKSLAVMFFAAGLSSILLVANSAFGLDAPVTDPDDAAGVSPTFNGATLTGDLVFEDGDIVFNNGSRIASGGAEDFTEFNFPESTLGAENAILSASMVVGSVGGNQGILMTPTSIQRSGGNLEVNLDAGREAVFKTTAQGGNNNVRISSNGNVTVSGNLNIGGSMVVGGAMDLPFRSNTAAISANAISSPTQLVACPAGTTKVISCQIYILGGLNLVSATGTRFRTDGTPGCSGQYRQTAAGNTSGIVTAMCL